ncbi:MAG: M48 family metallopeptidase [Opitutales bacterium]
MPLIQTVLRGFSPALLAAGLLAALTSCFTVPETGRSGLALLPEEQLRAMARSSFEELKRRERIADNPALQERIARIGTRIAEVAGTEVPPDEWEFVVFDDPDQINAFAMPGGKVGLYTGILKVLESDDELAAVLGHEVAHVTARHSNQRISRQLLVSGLGAALAIGTEDRMDERERELVMAGFGLGATIGVILPYGRTQETEADRIGLLYAARAGYDPRAALQFWQRMSAGDTGSGPPELLSTHPSDQTRIQHIREHLPEAIAIYEELLNSYEPPPER